MAATAAIAVASSTARAATPLKGGGSSFVNPVMQRWIETLPASLNIAPHYAVQGAGAAQSSIMAGELDFAAMELPLPADKLETSGLVQVPIVFGALAFVVNVDGLASDRLILDGGLLGGIYAGAIKTWNHPRIAEANPGLTLPEQDIRPFHLGTPAGAVFSTTTTIQNYLLARNEDWRARHGTRITKRWAVGSMTGTAAQMIEAMKTVPGSIGYVTLGDALRGGMTTVRLRNAAGKPVAPSLDALRAAVDQVEWSRFPDLVADLIDLPGDSSWPIVLASYALIQTNPADKARGDGVRTFLKHVVAHGSAAAAERQAVGLPGVTREAVLKRLSDYTG